MKYYLGISCEEYKNINSLLFCHADSIGLFTMLTEYCDYENDNCEIMTLYTGDSDSSNGQVLEKIKKVCNLLEKGDVFVLFFAGHGLEKQGESYILLPDYDESIFDSTTLAISEIRNAFSKSRGFCILIIDACNSGSNIGVVENDVACDTETGWAVFSSCSAKEESYPDVDKEQGAFSYCLTKVIEEWECNTDVGVERLKARVCDKMQKWCKKNNRCQTPTINCTIVGKQIIAKRNSKKCKDYVVAVRPNVIPDVKEKKMCEIEIPERKEISLWTANAGVIVPKKASVPEMLNSSVKMQPRTIASIKRNYEVDDYESVAELMWNKAITVLRNRILSMGVEFVGEMVGLDNPEYVRELPAFEVINLAADLGFINATGKMRLKQSDEIVRHYRDENVTEEMPRNEIETIVRACIQYILGYDDESISFEFSDFRNNLKREVFSVSKLEVLQASPYFYKKTTMRTLFNLLNMTDGAEYEIVSSNFVEIISVIWDSLSSDDRYSIGTNYSIYANNGDTDKVATYKYALEKVHGFDYVPENLRSLAFVNAARNLKCVHNGFNNFYNEPEAARNLERLGTKVPRPAIKESVSACLICMTGNPYGRSDQAISILETFLDKLDDNSWMYYLNNCLAFDEDFLYNISCGDERTKRWCEVVINYRLEQLGVKDGKMQEMLNNAAKYDKQNVKAYINALLKKIRR